MALKVKAVERLLKFDKESAGKYRYVLKPEIYSTLSQAKVIKEAAMRSGVNQGVMKPSVDLKDELQNAAIVITCYDRDGKEVKRVTSTDSGDIEDPENEQPSTGIDLRMRFLGQAKRQSRALDYARDDREEGMLEMTD